jgi:hypothetical protein
MVALARTCQQYGRFRDARALLEGAGAQGELMALCVFQGDFAGLQDLARKVCVCVCVGVSAGVRQEGGEGRGRVPG